MAYSTSFVIMLILSSCLILIMLPNSNDMNVIDSCWRSNPNWASNRRALADCAVGFGKEAIGGKNGKIYIVHDASDDPVNPRIGTLRHAVIQKEPIWIVFAKDMVISLKKELLVSNFKTIDGRGAKVEIANGPCIQLKNTSHVIIHGISIHDCKVGDFDGDGITVAQSSHIWIDHCTLSNCTDGLIDVVDQSTNVTISNSRFTQHNKVMLIGNDNSKELDKNMRVTLAFNHFGPGLVQRMPRVRFGYAHVANNMYERWMMYAIGGNCNPTIYSEGNYFMASDKPTAKQVTKRINGDASMKDWTWKSSEKDVFENEAFFVQSGSAPFLPNYSPSQSFPVAAGAQVPSLTSNAGVLQNL